MSNHTPIQLPLAIDGLIVEIPLTQGQIALVDAIDADLYAYSWFAVFYPKLGRFYAKRNTPRINGKGTTEYLHRVVLARMLGRPLLRVEEVDHVHRLMTLDNTRQNLRLATKSQNMRNQGAQRANATGFKGVSFDKGMKLWRARANVNGKELVIGYFPTPEAAALAYDNVIEGLYGEFAFKNFP